jgi:hypothetical protein
VARIRTIKPTIWQSEQLANVPRDARLLFIGLISHADDDGRLRGAPALIRSEVFPYDDDITPAAIDELLTALEAVRLVVRYVVDDQRYIAIPTFASHQAISKRTASRLPEPPSDPTESDTTPAVLPEDSGRTAGALRPSSRTTPARKGKGREEASPLRASAREATPIVDVHEIDALFAPLGRAPDARTRRRCIAIATAAAWPRHSYGLIDSRAPGSRSGDILRAASSAGYSKRPYSATGGTVLSSPAELLSAMSAAARRKPEILAGSCRSAGVLAAKPDAASPLALTPGVRSSGSGRPSACAPCLPADGRYQSPKRRITAD